MEERDLMRVRCFACGSLKIQKDEQGVYHCLNCSSYWDLFDQPPIDWWKARVI